ncbi:Serine/threonine protein kinase [Jatrophihabitans endophyticus]|uniref:non-specific serine/threonine protein kinase n=1 Tax=Jatrophihabitans endophyticus TaxID=1206085 RepID=A0A1M5PDN7_9ACTN|nr:serine/threonine-protein kinase [Jatrophihabitans endophyticus]SHG99383.1 Serine/threonine protein kinase [Jatrophihabitans endophyticus]
MTQPAPDLPGLRLERLLGSGGYSDVFLYRQQLPSRLVAVKVLRNSGLGEAQRSRFTAEANAMAGLADHPNIVPVFSASVSDDGRPYLVMQYYSQPNLAVRAASERLGVPEVLRVGIQIASAVETAHRAGILHRDIKPANLLISQYGAPGLTDFGIAGQLADIGSPADDDELGVSVPWAPPEVLYASAPTSVQSDVYALAATLWHLLVGRSPFEVRGGDNSAFALMRRVRDAPAPTTGRADVPAALDRLLRQAMSKDPAGRPATAIEFARRLQAVEQELSLPRTQIVVTTEGLGGDGDPEPPEHYSTAPATVARPLSVTAQPPPTYRAASPQDAAAAPVTDARPDAYAAQRSAAPLRYAPGEGPHAPSVRASPDHQPDHRVEPQGSRGRRTAGLLVAAGLVVVAAGVGVTLVATGGDDPGPTSTVSQDPGTQDAGLPGEDVPPGRPAVAARRAGSAVAFSWTYSARRRDDTYQWRETTGKRRTGVVTAPALRLAAATRTCVQVRVVRADGTNASATFSPEGCA